MSAKLAQEIEIRDMVSDRVKGMTLHQLADKYEKPYPSVHALLSREAVKKLLDGTTSSFVTMLPDVVANYQSFLADDDKRVRLESSRDVLKLTGIMASPAQTSLVVNMLNVVQGSVPPVISHVLNGLQGRDGGSSLEIVDGETVDV